MVLTKHQQVHIKERIRICKDSTDSCISEEDLRLSPTLAQQRKNLGPKLAKLAFQQDEHRRSFSAKPSEDNGERQDGCSSAEKCGYTLSRPVQRTSDGKHVHVSMHKMFDDDSKQKKCCMGKTTDSFCANKNWVPLDPKGKCTQYVHRNCSGTANTCGRHKFLSNATSKTNIVDWFCGFWYMGNVDAYIPGAYKTNPCNQTTTDDNGGGSGSGPSCKRTKQHQTAYNLIHDYCGKRPETGECACIQAHDLCNCRTSGKDCGVYGDFRQHYGRRFELYCWTHNNNNNGNKYSFTKLTPGSNPFGTTPVHCWSVACQYANRCGFFPQKTFERKCPNICMQYSSNSTINLKNVTGYKELAVNGFMMRCPGGSSSNAPKNEPKIETPLRLSTFHTVDSHAPNTWVEEKRATIQLTNKAKDRNKPKHGTRYFCISSSSPKIAFARPRNGCLKSGETTNIELYVSTAGLNQGQYFVSILVQDICDGGGPFDMLYQVHVFSDPPSNVPSHACTHGCSG